MAQHQGSSLDQPAQSSGAQDLSGWALGFISFGAVMMLTLGTFHFLAGLTALFDDTFYDVRRNYGLEVDTTTWGWIHLIGGLVLLVGSVGLLFGALWARLTCILLAFVSAILNFYSIPYYPAWSILMIALAIGVIWALVTNPHYGDEA
jgi:hypothetical protein